MNRMFKILIIGCSFCSLIYLPVNAQEDMGSEAANSDSVQDLGFSSEEAEGSTIQLLDASEITDERRMIDAADLAEQERVRIQAKAREGRMALDQAMQAMQKGQWALAVDLFDQALSNMRDVEILQEEIRIAREQKSEAYFQMARKIYEGRREGGNLNQAITFLDLSRETDPLNEKPDMLGKDIKTFQARQDAGKEVLPIEKEPKYEKAKIAIKELLLRGRKELEIGDYDVAEDTFEKVLVYDRYNRDALRFIEKVAEERWEARKIERDASVMKMMDEAERRWLLPLDIDKRGPLDTFDASSEAIIVEQSTLEAKLSSIVIDEIRFKSANISDVISFLVQASREEDEEGIGVNIIFMDPELSSGGSGGARGAPAAPAVDDPFGFGAPAGGAAGGLTSAAAGSIPPITLELRKVTLLDALKTVTQISGLYYRIERNMVIIEREGRGRLITRFYPVDPTRWIAVTGQLSSGGGGGGAAADPFANADPFGATASVGGGGSTDSDLRNLFTRYGVKIPDNGSIAYESMISQLVVTLTPDQFPQFEEVLAKINVAPRQVEIETRFVEVLQRDLEELGFEWILTDDAEILVQDGPGPVASRPRVQADANPSGLTGGLRFFDFDANSNSVQPNRRDGGSNSFLGDILSFSGILTNPELQMVVQALDQKGNTDLLSAPRVTTVHGVNAIIEVVEEIIYPTEFDITENNSDIEVSGTASANFFLPPTVEPGGFETRNIGVILNVTPTVNADNYTINLVMLPEIAELVDWLQYGSTIPLGDGTEFVINIPQPVFASRNISTSMIVWDGHTVVMGGLIREDLTTFEDKVPILGDIPIIGRLFRSEGRSSQKRNLLIFVTARLVDPAGNSINAQTRQDMATGSQNISSRGGPIATQ